MSSTRGGFACYLEHDIRSSQKPLSRTIAVMLLQKKAVVVGDVGCGKTCFVSLFAGEPFSNKYKPSVYEDKQLLVETRVAKRDRVKRHIKEYENVTIELTLADTSGDEAYDRLRPLSYLDADLVIICVAMNESPASVSQRWIPETKHYLPKVPILLVGTKRDLQRPEGRTSSVPTTPEQSLPSDFPKDLLPGSPVSSGPCSQSLTTDTGKLLASMISAEGFVECSSFERLDTEVRLLRKAIFSALTDGGESTQKWQQAAKMVQI